MTSPDKEPVLEITLSGEKVRIGRDDATLYTFLGRQMIGEVEVDISQYDHIFITHDEEEQTGTYVWKSNTGFDGLAKAMLQRRFPSYLNLREVAEVDIMNFEAHFFDGVADELNGGVPDGWAV